MRIGLLSDVHANLPALEAALEVLDREGVERLYCAGDLVGYNPWPNEVIARLRERGVRCIAGNHDRAAVAGEDPWMNPYAAAALKWTVGALTGENRAWLAGLPPHLRDDLPGGVRLAVHHGAPDDPDRYVLPEDAGNVLLDLGECDVLVLGHTHLPFVHTSARGAIVNPGGVGQPRDGDPRSCAAVLEVRDGAKPSARLLRFPYDVARVSEAIRAAGLPDVLGKRLHAGW